jgi:hypothetical protein
MRFANRSQAEAVTTRGRSTGPRSRFLDELLDSRGDEAAIALFVGGADFSNVKHH